MEVKITVSALVKHEMLQQQNPKLYIADKGDPNISFSFFNLLLLEREDAKKTNQWINQSTNQTSYLLKGGLDINFSNTPYLNLR